MIIKCCQYLESDKRFKRWGKVVAASDINLGNHGGYALGGQWVSWAEAVHLRSGYYLVAAAETGSRAYRSYNYVLVDWQGKVLTSDECYKLIEWAKYDEGYKARAMNSSLYTVAFFIKNVPVPVLNEEKVS